MESYVNEPFLKKRSKYARWGSYLGLGSLFVGLMISTRNPLLAYVFLLVGLLGSSFGAYMANRYVRQPRADQTLGNALEGLDKRYALYHYYLAADHVIASHYGLTVVVPRSQKGEIRYENGRWHHKAGLRKFLQFFGEPGVGKPDQDLAEETKLVKEWIDQVLPEQDVPVNGVVVFTNAEAVLQVREAPVPAVAVADLPEHMKRGLRNTDQPILTTAQQKELRRTLDAVVAQS